MAEQPTALTPHILVVDDDDRLRKLLRRYLAEQGFVVSTAANAAEARGRLAVLAYDLVVLDVMMPGETGFELTRSLRASTPHGKPLAILLLTARAESSDRIEGFEIGADDYLLKPFEPRELVLRIHAILRRMPREIAPPVELKFGPWRYNLIRDELRRPAEDGIGDEVLRLTGMEAGLMRLLAATPGVAQSRDVLAEKSGTTSKAEDNAKVGDRTIDVQVTRLRRKIEPDSKNPRYLVTVRGEGYMLIPDTDMVGNANA